MTTKRQSEEAELQPEKRRRATETASEQLDLVYPFWYAPDVITQITPPFLDPDGPLYNNEGKLSIRLQQPIAEINKSVGLLMDNTLGVNRDGQLGLKVSSGQGIQVTAEGLSVMTDNKSITFNENGQIQVHVDSEGPLEVTDEGLNVKVDTTTIEVDDSWKLAVKLDPQEPIDSGPEGLRLNIDDTMLVAEDSDTGLYELGVHLNAEGPITADTNGLDLEIDPKSLQNEQINGATALAVKLVPDGGLITTESGIKTNVDNTSVLIDNNTLKVKLTTNGGLSAPGTGLKVNVDDQSISNNNGTLEVKLDPAGHIKKGASGLSVNSDIVEVDPTGPIYKTSNGLNLRVEENSGLEIISEPARDDTFAESAYALSTKLGNGLTVASESITVTASPPLTVTSSGVGLEYDESAFTVQNNKLALIKNPNPFPEICYAEFGDPANNQGNMAFYENVTWNKCVVRPFITLTWLGSTVVGMMKLKVISSDFELNSTAEKPPIVFSFVLDTEGQLAQSPKITKKVPDTQATLNRIRPSNLYINDSVAFSTLQTSPYFVKPAQLKWFTPITFKPKKTGEYQDLKLSTIRISSMTVEDRAILYFHVEIDANYAAGTSFFKPPSSDKILECVEISFSYSGLRLTS
ncbi:fiber protein [Aviadenovirus bubonis]|nr:fiber protein [Owl adenovirus]